MLAGVAGASFRGGIVVYGGEEVLPFGEGLWAVTYRELWQWGISTV
jgi:hypothetical protein